MCKSIFSALLLALFLAPSLSAEPVYTLTETQKQAILTRLSSLENNLTSLKGQLQNSEAITLTLQNDLTTLQSNLETLKANLQNSEADLAKVQEQLTQASQTLDLLEKQLKDSQFWEIVKIVSFSILSCFIGGLVVHFL